MDETRAQQIDAQADLLISALSACEIWEALRTEATGTEFELPALPPGTPLAKLSEAIAERHVDAQRELQRLIAPRLLKGRVREFLQDRDDISLPDGLLTLADWKTLLDSTIRPGSAAVADEAQPHLDWMLSGLALRHLSDAQPEALVSGAEQLFAQPGDTDAIDSFTFLSQEQFLALWVALTAERAGLQAVLVRALFAAGRADWWFWEPLTMFVTPHFQPSSHWQVLLHQLAALTRVRGGFARLRSVVADLASAAEKANDPEVARLALWDHLHWARPTTDRNRYLLRQLAHEQLFPELRGAVQATRRARPHCWQSSRREISPTSMIVGPLNSGCADALVASNFSRT